jgi:hypothetical protein
MVTDMKMENEVKLTIIATGFPVMDGAINMMDAEHVAPDPSLIDIPPFLLRNPAALRRARNNVAATSMD